jgi:class 3 adenylate cyclase
MAEAGRDYIERSRQLLRTGDPFLALEQTLAGLQYYCDSVALLQQHAKVLIRTGSPQSAHVILRRLVEEGHSDPETLGLLARTYEDFGLNAAGARKAELLSQARDLYLEAHRAGGDPWWGVSGATISLLLDDREEAASVAAVVWAQALERLEDASPGDACELQATLGEAALIQGNLTEAEERYSRAADLALGLGDLVSMRRNARALLGHAELDPSALDQCFGIPVVAVFSGHMIDRPGRPRPRFPAEREEAVAAALREHLARYGKVAGYAAASGGADILFHEAVRALGGESHVVLACPPDEFVEESVPLEIGAKWRERFEAVLAHAKDVTITSEQKGQTHGTFYEYSNLFRDGLAILHARQLETSVVRMVVWDEGPGDGAGGTASVAGRWVAQGYALDRVGTGYDSQARVSSHGSTLAATDAAADMRLVGILFADALRFSAIVEPRIPDFVEHFMGAVAGALARSSVQPLVKNTWGDGLYFVCASPHEAGTLALDLCDAVAAVDWSARRLPADLALRIAVHAGPAYYCLDPVLGSFTFFGAHVSRAARIEPVTPPGQVYASQAFAAIAAAQETDAFVLEYVGRVPLAKGAGVMPMYRLSRTAPISDEPGPFRFLRR